MELPVSVGSSFDEFMVELAFLFVRWPFLVGLLCGPSKPEFISAILCFLWGITSTLTSLSFAFNIFLKLLALFEFVSPFLRSLVPLNGVDRRIRSWLKLTSEGVVRSISVTT